MFKGTRIASVPVVLTLLLSLSGCGSSQSSAESPESSEPEKSAETQSEAAPAAKEAEAPAETKPAEPEGPELSKPALDIISDADTAWVFNFQSSEAGEKAQKECDERHKDKPKQRAQCMTKARSGFIADAMEFKKDKSGQDVWVIYKIKGNKPTQIYSVPISYGEAKAGVVKVKKVGNSKGSAPFFAGTNEISVKLVSNYSMELDEPRHGKLAYDARLGFISR